jgi:DMSO/TMAO reductase YedYZ molybdopterin-dependent catalytic subunit
VSIRGKVHRSRIFSVPDLETMSTDGETVRVERIIGRAVPVTQATHATVVSSDGSYRASIPLEDLASGGVLAFGSGRGILSSGEGGPLRLTVVDGKTLCWNVKDVAVIDVTVGAAPDDVPARPTH